MGIDLAGKSVLVTGASIGIGRETALRFAAAGCRVALTYFEHRAEAEEAAKRCLGLGAPDALAISLQLGDEGSGCAAAARPWSSGSAASTSSSTTPGSSAGSPFLEQDFGEIDEQIVVNLLGVMKLTWCALPMRE